MKRFLSALIMSTILILAFSTDATAQKKNKKKTDTAEASADKKSEIKSIKELIKKCTKSEGLFTIYQDTTNGTAYLEISADQIGKEYIYFSYIENGVLDAGYFRGAYRGSKIFSVHKDFERIEFLVENTSYYWDENNAISKASEANVNRPIILSEKIEGQNKEKTKFLIKADNVFLNETFSNIVPDYPPTYKGFKLTKLDKDKSKFISVKNYPANTDVCVQMVYGTSGNGSSSAITDDRSVNITYQHSLIEVPQNDFKARFDDPRIGYFMTQVTDLTSPSATPYRDMIHRWNLKKKDPSAALSEPVKPITWWIENTTPVELRPMIKAGVENWNLAFEKAGFKNAVVVNIQPDDADWDAGDIRYNVLRWTSSPQPPFGGYGPSFVNPRTGEILGADIMLEYVYILGRLRQEEIFEAAALGIIEENEFIDPNQCFSAELMQNEMLFANYAIIANDLEGIEKNKFIQQSLYRLVLHEVGHTLGLNHNMKGSTLQSVQDIKDADKMNKEGLCNSVMEYPAINFARNKEDQTLYYDEVPGFYDHWAIEFGYSEAMDDPAKMKNLLARSSDHRLAFGNDADDMRSAGKAIDPRVNIYDLSDDPVTYGIDRIELVNTTLTKLKDKFSKDDQSFHELRNAYLVLTGQSAIQLGVMSRQIGGVYVDRTYVGDKSDVVPFTPVPAAKQKAAMNAISKYGFAPDAFSTSENLYNYLQMQRRGFNFFSGGEDPKIHDRILGVQKNILNHLMHKNVLQRITDSELYGNQYPLNDFMYDLTDAIFQADRKISVNSKRQNLQVEYTNRLLKILDNKSDYDYISQGAALQQLQRIKQWMASGSSPDKATSAHRAHVIWLIEEGLKKS